MVSILNVTSATAADGGRYTCRASNPLGAVEHSARLNIYGEINYCYISVVSCGLLAIYSMTSVVCSGPPSIRPMSTVRAVAGENLTLHCPYAGYPIRSIEVHLIG